jgi:hypothetical protein
MRQTGHWKGEAPLVPEKFLERLEKAIHGLDVEQTRKGVESFVKNPENLAIWSRAFFLDVASRIKFV